MWSKSQILFTKSHKNRFYNYKLTAKTLNITEICRYKMFFSVMLWIT